MFIEAALFDFLLLWMAVWRIHGCCVRRVFAVVKSLVLVSSLTYAMSQGGFAGHGVHAALQ